MKLLTRATGLDKLVNYTTNAGRKNVVSGFICCLLRLVRLERVVFPVLQVVHEVVELVLLTSHRSFFKLLIIVLEPIRQVFGLLPFLYPLFNFIPIIYCLHFVVLLSLGIVCEEIVSRTTSL